MLGWKGRLPQFHWQVPTLLLVSLSVMIIYKSSKVTHSSPGRTTADLLGIEFPKCDNKKLEIDQPDKTLNLMQLLRSTLDKALEPPPGIDDMCRMSGSQLEAFYFRYIATVQKHCTKRIRLGNARDGGWEVCAEDGRIDTNSCLVYSFGQCEKEYEWKQLVTVLDEGTRNAIFFWNDPRTMPQNDNCQINIYHGVLSNPQDYIYTKRIAFDFSFDDAVRDFLGCEVHSFDPSMKVADHTHSPGVYFHALGLSDTDSSTEDVSQWKMRTYGRVRKELGHEKRPPVILKIDIENWEFVTLPKIISSGELEGTDQLLVELHAYPMYNQMSAKGYWMHILLFLKNLYDQGFRIFWADGNKYCTYESPFLNKKQVYGCMEISFMRDRTVVKTVH